MYISVAKVNRKIKEELLYAELILLHRINSFIHFNMIEVDENAKEYWKSGTGKLSKIG